MSKLLAILATLKAILIAASVALARGDILPVILISIMLNLTQLGAKPIGQAVLRDPVASPPSQDRTADFECTQPSFWRWFWNDRISHIWLTRMDGTVVHRKLRFGPFELSIGERVLRRDGRAHPLGDRALDIFDLSCRPPR